MFKSIQSRIKFSTLDLKYCSNKEDMSLDPLDSKNELTIFQRFDIKSNKVYSECHNTQDIVLLSEPKDMVFRWEPKKGMENECCPIKKERVIKLPLSGMWILASTMMLKQFKYFQLVSMGKQRIGSQFGVSALHNAEEELWRCIPCSKFQIEKGFQEQKIIPSYCFHPTLEDITIFDPINLKEGIESKTTYPEIQLLPTGHFNINIKERSENKNLYQCLLIDTSTSLEHEKDYIEDYEHDEMKNRIVSPEVDNDECKDDADCENGYACFRDNCVLRQDIGL